jgi:hypothetical protein
MRSVRHFVKAISCLDVRGAKELSMKWIVKDGTPLC